MTLRIFIGYDSKEDDAYKVCEKSMRLASGTALSIEPLDAPRLRHAGIYNRDHYYDGQQMIDTIDGKPFSTAFSFTRFLVPSICQWQGLALYCDCDFLWRADVSFLFHNFDHSKAIAVVKHYHDPPEKIKMQGEVQTRYYRKNWSSLILYNCTHPSNYMLTPEKVNKSTGQWLHAFGWLHDWEIDGIDRSWNCLVGIDTDITDPNAVHFTKGTPSMPGHENDEYADEWREILERDRKIENVSRIF